MIAARQFLTPLDATVDGVPGNRVCVLELDDKSFRAWLVSVLYSRGAIAAQSNDGTEPLGELVELVTRKDEQ